MIFFVVLLILILIGLLTRPIAKIAGFALVVALICAAYHVGTVERQSSYEAQIAQQSATIRAYVAYLAKTQPEKFTITRESSR